MINESSASYSYTDDISVLSFISDNTNITAGPLLNNTNDIIYDSPTSSVIFHNPIIKSKRNKVANLLKNYKNRTHKPSVEELLPKRHSKITIN